MAAAVFIGFFSSGATDDPSSTATSRAKEETALRVLAPEKCPAARKGVAFYRAAYLRHRARMGAGRPSTPAGLTPACSHVRSSVSIWRSRAYVARVTANAVLYIRAAKRWQRQLSNPTNAICHVFGRYCSQALAVASCESGRGVHAQNGQYLGMFQMGSYARSRYGHGYDALTQAKAAYAYFVDSGRDWSPWSCKP